MDFRAYGQAVIHLAWYRNDKICHLLFGMLELRPCELPRALGCCMKSSRVGNKGKRYVHYERFAVSVSHAIGWYEGVLGGCLIFPSARMPRSQLRKSTCTEDHLSRNLSGLGSLHRTIWCSHPTGCTGQTLIFCFPVR